ncbi:alpha/beta fold hydrolase [Chitinophaga nivalis]|uniref:Alpha/beta fold hydrolase n=1 Tax=Chitinophaga nivalis TaxID=2991709 RepID=A0ABT3ISW9_9BACT|nr:alpha/beta fold hydrolase [Chitinophaga nivalis]MCW3463490.1 alpha/beta fold hydrolase [Chitinophaga nivalis]MCW3486820.1 alpha/beta fold hydrolase [Chitinophaga nivalis]
MNFIVKARWMLLVACLGYDQSGSAVNKAAMEQEQAGRRSVASQTADTLSLFRVNNFRLQQGTVLPQVTLVYKTIGKLSPQKDNVILIPSWFAGTHRDSEQFLTGSNRALDPDKYFIIFTNMLGNGVSSSPSNTPPPFHGPDFPAVTLTDNVTLQAKMLQEVWGINKIKLLVGWSMGGMQSYQWAALYPEQVAAMVVFCAAARTGHYNQVFLHALESAIRLDPVFNNGHYQKTPVGGLKTFSAIYAGWGFSEPFYRKELFRQFKATTALQFIQTFWEPNFASYDANDVLSMMDTWKNGDISANEKYQHDLKQALQAIRAKTIIAPDRYDRYFPPADSENEVKFLRDGRLKIMESEWGHMTMFNREDIPAFDAPIRQLLEGK